MHTTEKVQLIAHIINGFKVRLRFLMKRRKEDRSDGGCIKSVAKKTDLFSISCTLAATLLQVLASCCSAAVHWS